MGEATKIEWAHHTWNPWRGCAHAELPDGTPHPGCLNCYAEAMAPRNPKTLGEWGEDGLRAIGTASYWEQPFGWNAKVPEGERHRVFFASLADVFEDREDLVAHRERAFRIIDLCWELDFLILTKRPQNIRRMWPGADSRLGRVDVPIRKNVWLLTSVSDQATADAMVPELLKCRDLVPVLGLSAEPLLGPIDLTAIQHERTVEINALTGAHGVHRPLKGEGPHVDWVIVGGESGHGARACNLGWVQGLVDQCKAASVACFVKQMGARPIDSNRLGAALPAGERHGRLYNDPNGGDWNEWQADLRVRQMPEVSHA